MPPPAPPEVPLLDSGWNLIGLPLSPGTALSADDFLRQIGGGPADFIARWTNGGWETHVRDFPFNNFLIEPGVGYLVHLQKPGTLTIAGRSFDAPPPVQVSAGWTLVALPYNAPAYYARDVLVELAAAGLNATLLSQWRGGGWESTLRDLPSQGFALERGRAYFLRTSRSGTWTPARSP